MPELKIPIESLQRCGLPPLYYMTERLKAVGAPVDVEGAVQQHDDPEKKNIIFTWGSVEKKDGCPVFPGCANREDE